MTQFGDALRWSWVMGGLARDYSQGYVDRAAGIHGGRDLHARLAAHWLDVSEATGMPIDPRLWAEAPIGSSYPACMAVKAADDQPRGSGPPETTSTYRCLRALREGLMCFRRKLDTTEALVEEARGAGLDAERFRRSLSSHAIVEAFGADLGEAREPPVAAGDAGRVRQATVGERVTFPATFYFAEDGECRGVFGLRTFEEHRAAAEAAGAVRRADAAPEPLEALRRFGRMATAEVAAVCDLPGPQAPAELWRLAAEWRVKPVPVVSGHLWEAV
jgi:hypothetical protein